MIKFKINKKFFISAILILTIAIGSISMICYQSKKRKAVTTNSVESTKHKDISENENKIKSVDKQQIKMDIPVEVKTVEPETKNTTSSSNSNTNSNIKQTKSTSLSSGTSAVKKPSGYSYEGYTLQNNGLNNNGTEWYFMRNTSFTRPSAFKSSSFLRQYNAYYLGDNRKVIYLTFDEGNSVTYASQNLDTLKKHNIKATFFVTKPFIDSHPDLVKRMVNEGHIVGNHSVNHVSMPSLANGDNIVNFIKEISDTEQKFKEVTGKSMTRIFRYPQGAFSDRTLSFTRDMGYRCYFWSFAYKDWEENCNTKEQSLQWLKSYYHPGAIYLLHGVSRGNSEALDKFITYMQSQGYSFDVVTNITSNRK